MPKRKINNLKKECDVLLLKLSKSDISSRQENPMQISESLDLPYRSRGKECSVLLRRLTKYETRNAMKGTRIIAVPYLPKKTPYMLINELSELKLQAERKTKPKASKLQIHFGMEFYLKLFQEYMDEFKVDGIDMKEILSEKNINEELFPLNRISGPEFIELNMDLVECIIETSRRTSRDFVEFHLNNELDRIYEAARITYHKNKCKILAQRPYRTRGKYCYVSLDRSESKRKKTTASDLAEERVPNVINELSELKLQAERRIELEVLTTRNVLEVLASGTEPAVLASGTEPAVLASGTEPAVLASGTEPAVLASGTEPAVLASGTEPAVLASKRVSYEVYLKVFKEYLTLLHSGSSEMKEKLSDRNITRKLLIMNRLYATYSLNRDLVMYLMESHQEGFGEIQLRMQNRTIIRAAKEADKQIQEAETRRKRVIAPDEERPIAPDEERPIAPEEDRVNVGAEQRSSKLEDISGDEYEVEERTIERKDYLFPIDAPEIPKAAITLMSDCPGYLSNLKETNVNENKMWLESGHVKEQTEINASQNKVRNKDEGLRKIQKGKNDRRSISKADIFLKMMQRINSRHRFFK